MGKTSPAKFPLSTAATGSADRLAFASTDIKSQKKQSSEEATESIAYLCSIIANGDEV